MSLRLQRLFRLCQSVCASSHICPCPRLSFQHGLSAGAFQSCRFKSSSFILGQSEVLLQDGVEIQELPWVVRRLDPREFPFVNSNSADGRRYICGVKDEQFVQQLQDCVTIHQACIQLGYSNYFDIHRTYFLSPCACYFWFDCLHLSVVVSGHRLNKIIVHFVSPMDHNIHQLVSFC